MAALMFNPFLAPLFCGYVPLTESNVFHVIEWLLMLKLVAVLVMVEITTILSFGMLLVWLLQKEYKHLFGTSC
jgi:hypothetical protein